VVEDFGQRGSAAKGYFPIKRFSNRRSVADYRARIAVSVTIKFIDILPAVNGRGF